MSTTNDKAMSANSNTRAYKKCRDGAVTMSGTTIAMSSATTPTNHGRMRTHQIVRSRSGTGFVRGAKENDASSSPLERFDLSQLVVMGIIWGVEEPRALIKDPTGKGYIVRAGTPIGKNKGRILRILDNKVVVKETYLDHLDRATTKEVELELYANGRNGA